MFCGEPTNSAPVNPRPAARPEIPNLLTIVIWDKYDGVCLRYISCLWQPRKRRYLRGIEKQVEPKVTAQVSPRKV